MFVTRATRHDRADVEKLLLDHEWDLDLIDKCTAFIARDGAVVGTVRLIEVAPQTVVVEDVLVHKDRRAEGIGRRLIQAAMNSRGGTLYLCCHDDRKRFYAHFGFEELAFDDLPREVQQFMRDTNAWPDSPEHRHYFMKAR
jgi:N-acetylglutamate synthase-like GNAT family acetyltransferase